MPDSIIDGNGLGNFAQVGSLNDLKVSQSNLTIDPYGRADVSFGNGNGEAVDAFGRLRVSNGENIFESNNIYDLSPQLWQSGTTGSGTVTHDYVRSMAKMNTGIGTSGNNVLWQTRQYLKYQPGKSHAIAFTGCFNGSKTNLLQRYGYYDDQDGLFFEVSGAEVSLVKRSSVSGTVQDTKYPQSSWNLDRLDGTGSSGFVYDLSKANIYFIDLEWLGVGKVRYGVWNNGAPIYCHKILHENTQTSTYMRTATLPVRAEIGNMGSVTGSSVLNQICVAVVSEGGYSLDRGYDFSAMTGSTTQALTSRRPLLSIRPRPTFGTGSIINRVQIAMQDFHISSETNPILFEIVVGGAITSGVNWQNVNNQYSSVEFDRTGSTISGGIVIHSGYIGATNQSTGTFDATINTKFPLTLDYQGSNPIGVSIVGTAIGGAATALVSMNWKELF